MDQFAERGELLSSELKRLAGLGREGEKNFEGMVIGLQMGGYLVIQDFRRRINRRGLPYGWPISVYTTPEALRGCGHVISAYAPAESKERIFWQIQEHFSEAAETELTAVLGGTQ